MGNPIRTSMDRLYSIAIGGIVAVVVNVLVFPMWAGEQLHKELVNNFNSMADSLEGNFIFILNGLVHIQKVIFYIIHIINYKQKQTIPLTYFTHYFRMC